MPNVSSPSPTNVDEIEVPDNFFPHRNLPPLEPDFPAELETIVDEIELPKVVPLRQSPEK
jgi:hypothetical protein